MKFIGFNNLEYPIVTLFTFRDKQSFDTLEGYTKQYKYNLLTEELFDGDTLFLKGKLYTCMDKGFKIEII